MEREGESVNPAAGIDGLDLRLAHVLEPEMRRRLVLEALHALPSDEARQFIRAVHDRRPARTPGSDHLRDILLELLLGSGVQGAEPLPYELRRSLYEAAALAEDEVLMELLRSHGGAGGPEDDALRLPRELEELPLGLRRSLAKGGDPLRLEQLARDSDALVIRNLLRNSRLCEEDVVRIAALRPVAVTTLVEIVASPRWSSRTRVRVALVRNPQCPPELGVKLLGCIPLASLHEMRRDPDLPERVHRHLEREIER
ncbi:MAG: hypothetical protein JRG96_15250, partial [Deltaproteobacteria bacterium]|nr:hypothetical protein [Deltaproteobacteria bacterium]